MWGVFHFQPTYRPRLRDASTLAQVLKLNFKRYILGLRCSNHWDGRKWRWRLTPLELSLLNGPKDWHQPYIGLIVDCKAMMAELKSTIKHVRREANMVADALAKLGEKTLEELVILDEYPAEIGMLLVADLMNPSGSDMLIALMEHPVLISASRSFSAFPERKFSVSGDANLESSTQCKYVYVFQREYATVDPALVAFVGTDEATTCVGIVIRNRKNGMTSVAHMDSPNVVDVGLSQMLSLVVSPSEDAVLDVHIVGAFQDATPQLANRFTSSEDDNQLEGYSVPLCTKIVETLGNSRENFHLQIFHVLKHNTRWDSEGNAYPIFNGLLVESSNGSILPASFDRSTRCPDEIIRRIRVGASYEDPRWTGRLLETYETWTDRFVIAPAAWSISKLYMALTVRELSDLEILLTCSTSPTAEGPDFVENERRLFEYVIQHPDWREAFPSNKPRMFERTAGGHWTRL